ncbi:unnamed protein product [Musa textilis]
MGRSLPGSSSIKFNAVGISSNSMARLALPIKLFARWLLAFPAAQLRSAPRTVPFAFAGWSVARRRESSDADIRSTSPASTSGWSNRGGVVRFAGRMPVQARRRRRAGKELSCGMMASLSSFPGRRRTSAAMRGG